MHTEGDGITRIIVCVTGTNDGKTQYCKVRPQQLHCRPAEICCFTTAKRQLLLVMLMLPRVDQVDDSNVQIYCTATAVVWGSISLCVSVSARVCLDLRGCVRCAWQWSDG